MKALPEMLPTHELLPEEMRGYASGEKCKTFCCRYFHDGAWWSLNITAYDCQDAEARAAKLGNLQLLGEHMLTIPVRSGLGPLMKLVCWIRNNVLKL